MSRAMKLSICPAGWRWHYGLVTLTPTLAFLLILLFVEESPRYLGLVGKTQQQQAVLTSISNRNNIRASREVTQQLNIYIY